MTLLDGRPRLVVSRTMSKAFACAGLRLGSPLRHRTSSMFCASCDCPTTSRKSRRCLRSTALEHADLLLENVDRLIDSRDRISQHLDAAGFTVYPSDSNFVLFGSIASPHDLWQKLLDRGILIRDIGIDHHDGSMPARMRKPPRSSPQSTRDIRRGPGHRAVRQLSRHR